MLSVVHTSRRVAHALLVTLLLAHVASYSAPGTERCLLFSNTGLYPNTGLYSNTGAAYCNTSLLDTIILLE